jgi:hypothetical protein
VPSPGPPDAVRARSLEHRDDGLTHLGRCLPGHEVADARQCSPFVGPGEKVLLAFGLFREGGAVLLSVKHDSRDIDRGGQSPRRPTRWAFGSRLGHGP